MSAQRLVIPDTAFRLSTGKKRKRKEDSGHLAYIRSLPCLVTGRTDNVQAAHVRYGDRIWGKREAGAGEKPDDRWCVPLHRDQHWDQHKHGEREWWQQIGIDPLAVACALAGATGDEQAGIEIIEAARKRKQR